MKHVIIGAGAAGITAAKTIRKLDSKAEITLISSDDSVYSRCMLDRYLSKERNEKTLNFVADGFFLAKSIKWIPGTTLKQINIEDHTVILSDASILAYDKLLLATGSHSVIPPIGTLKNAENVVGLRNLSDAQRIVEMSDPQKGVVIIGSGLVGMDAAYGLLKRETPVSIVEMGDHILPLQLDETASKTYQILFEEHGCKFSLGHKVVDTESDTNGKIVSVILDDGTVLNCGLVIAAVGVKANTDVLPPLAFNGSGVLLIDAQMKTALPDVFAAGDVTGLSGIWLSAVKQGEVAAYSMTGNAKKYDDTYALRNTMNYFGLPTLSLGSYCEQAQDEVFVRECANSYQRIVLRDGVVQSVILQGNLDYSGIWQYLIKNEVNISAMKNKIFKLSFADFFATADNGEYQYLK